MSNFGAKHLSPWMFAVLEFLSDGEWHDRHEAINHACKFVPPGVAHRRREGHNRRRRQAQAQGVPYQRVSKPVDDELAVGRRQVVRDSIYGATSLERNDNMIRITPVGETLLKQYAGVYQ